jgi:predicted Zn-dependent peptidase
MAMIFSERLKTAVPELASVRISHVSHVLPGMFVISAAGPNESAAKTVQAVQDTMRALIQSGATPAEVDRARILMTMEINKQFSQPESMAAAWLDSETLKSPRPSVIATLIRGLSTADVQRVATRLFKDAPVAAVVVGNYEQFKAAFGDKLETPAKAAPDAKADPALPIKKP